MNRFPVTKSQLLLCVLASLLCYVHFAQAQQQSISSAGPVVTCPENHTMNICAPVGSPAPMKFEDFNPSDDNTPTAEIEFAMEERKEVLTDVTVLTQQYTFTDKDGNSTHCELIYNIANRFMQAPVIDDQNQICQADFFRGLKLGSANYIIYEDDNGKPGNNLGICDQPGLLCAAQNFGIDANQSGISKLWVTEFMSFPDASVCESSASLLNVEVIEKPSARLTTSTQKATAGSILNLMDFVEENTSGFWNGEGVYSTLNADGSTIWLFSATGEGVSKLYYTVSNFTCSQSYLLLIEPEIEEDPLAGASIGFTLNFNETKTFAIGNTTITFTSIEDSRCPVEQSDPNIAYDCAWEGEAIATLEISNDLGTVVETFQVGGFCFPDQFCFGELKEILGLNFWLTGIHPYPVWDNNIDDESYMVSFHISSATPIIITDTIDSPLIADNTTQEEDQAILAATLADIKALTEGISCESSVDWKFTSIAATCFNEYIAYPQQINEATFLASIQAYNFAFYEYMIKWNLYATTNCINGEAVLNYNLLEPEVEEDPLAEASTGFTLNFNETKTIAIGNTSIIFTGIQDSRCPVDQSDPNIAYACEWEGEATATLEIRNDLGTVVETFTIGGYCFPEELCYGEIKEILGLQFHLTGIYPFPVWDDNIDDESYIVSLFISSPTIVAPDADTPLIGDNTTREEDIIALDAALTEIYNLAQSTPCEDGNDWKFTSVYRTCPPLYLPYSSQIDETAFLKTVLTYYHANIEFSFKWNKHPPACTDELYPTPIGVICEDGEAVLNYNQIELEPTITLGDQFTINFNETKTIVWEDGNTTISFVEVDESRCPEGVDCIQAGYAIVTLEITSDTGTESIQMGVYGLCGDDCSERDISPKGYDIQLISVDPYPNIYETIEDADYSLTLIVEKTSSYEEDQAELEAMFADIKATAESVVCENEEDWKFTAYGSKACGGPQGFIAYSTQIDETAFLASVGAYFLAEAEFNAKWRIYSTCDVPIPPQSISCVDGKAVFDHNPVEQLTPVSTTDLVNAQNNFALDIFKEANALDAEEENIIISPLSVAIALAMVTNGAKGETLEEFQDVMHLSDYEPTNVNAGYAEYIQKLQNLDENLSLEIANAVFYDDMGIVVNPEFIETVEQYYNAQIEVKDFTDVATVTEINDWVKASTKQKIEKIINEIGTDEVMFLLNAIYFNGGWSQPFDPELTKEGSFTLEDGSVETVDMMGHRDQWQIYANNNFKALNMPLGDSIYNMLFILPEEENTPLKTFADNFSLNDFEEITTGLTERDYEIKIPKFELSYENKMKDDLMNLGLVLPFDGILTDLSNLGSAGGILYVSRVIHKTFLKVDEEGATAAAVTAVGIAAESLPPSVNLNRPFLCVIWEKADNSILFIAKIMNPNDE